MHARTRPSALAALALLLGACPEPDPSQFDATCTRDADCAVVVDEGFCGACSQLAALQVDAAEDFERRQARHAEHRTCRFGIFPGCGGIDPSLPAWCDAGTCRVDFTEDAPETR